MAWIRTVSDEEATGRLAAAFEAARRRAGRVFNVVRLMSLNPPVLDASMGLYLQVMHAPSSLSRARREALAVVVSQLNGCHY